MTNKSQSNITIALHNIRNEKLRGTVATDQHGIVWVKGTVRCAKCKDNIRKSGWVGTKGGALCDKHVMGKG